MKVRLLKGMVFDGKQYDAGAIVDMDDSMASSLVGSSAASYNLDSGESDSERSKVRLLQDLTLDGKKHLEGDEIDIDDSTAQELVDDGMATYELKKGDRSARSGRREPRPTSDAHVWARMTGGRVW